MIEIPLERDWRLRIIEPGEESPLENHAPMELAVNHRRRAIYAHELLVRVYGTDSVTNTCNHYTKKF